MPRFSSTTYVPPSRRAAAAARRREETWRRSVSEAVEAFASPSARPWEGEKKEREEEEERRQEQGRRPQAEGSFRRAIALRGCPGQNVHLRRRVWLLLLGLDHQAVAASVGSGRGDGEGTQVGRPRGESRASSPRRRRARRGDVGDQPSSGSCDDEAEQEGQIAVPDEAQIRLDVDRSLNHFTPRVYGRQSTRDECREPLFRVMWRVLARYPPPQLNYYQGFHDLSSVFLLQAVSTEVAPPHCRSPRRRGTCGGENMLTIARAQPLACVVAW
jgi:hypothetical protein